jgi:hypothetical protein
LAPVAPLRLDPPARVVDPTLFQHESHFYLFGNALGSGSGALLLWVADALDQTFALHPYAPVLISPKGSRMAGAILRTDGRLIRFGQDGRFGYGDGILAFEIEQLSPTEYRERPLATLRFTDRRGPHTLNFGAGELVFDWYRERFAILAGVRRLAFRLSARRT